ncbi:MAG: polysaccharide deacetylase family protein [Muribaculaceae bacterium]
MFVEQPPLLYRMLFPECAWRINKKRKCVYLTFDDGPIPEVTPWVLDVLDRYGVKATFFMVGDNVARHPELLEEVLRRGHSVGNHTMNHLQGRKVSTEVYLDNIERANALIHTNLFRPPHGLMRFAQSKAVRANYTVIMYDVVTRDYARNIDGEGVFANVKRYARKGSIIVFHDSLKAEKNMKYALPKAIEWLKENGYEFESIPMHL